MNSSSMITSRNVYANPTAYKGFLSLIAHEYFHLWNVKRIRPLELGPFNYNEEVYTNQLWFLKVSPVSTTITLFIKVDFIREKNISILFWKCQNVT